MPLTLFHGPAGAGKTSFLLRRLWEKYGVDKQKQSHFLVVPTNRSVEAYQKKLLEEVPPPAILTGDPLIPFDRFLFRLLKLNLPRVHQATSSLTRNIIRKLLFEKKYPSFEKGKTFSGIISELASTFINLKKNGLYPERAKKFFERHNTDELEDLVDLFGAYQKTLRDIYYYDEGDLYAETLRLASKGQLTLPKNLKAIYFDRLFPVTLGQREIIKELASRFPQLDITLSYSFDYQAGEDPYLYPAYSFLGELAAENEYSHLTNIEKMESFYSFTDPASETEWVVNQIKEHLKKGRAPESLGVILPAYPYYHRRLTELLEQENIPFFPAYSPLLSRFSYLKPDQISRLIPLMLEMPSTPLFEAASALAQLEEFEKKWEFEKNLVLNTVKDSEQLACWKQEELSRVHLETKPALNGVALLSLTEALAYDFDFLFIAGFSDHFYPQPVEEHPFYSTEMLLDHHMREILEGPAYRHGVEKNKLQQAINRTRVRTCVSYPKILWDGKEQFPSRLYETDVKYVQMRAQSPLTFRPALDTSKKPPEFPQPRRSQFNISALEDYQKCPYQYYARHYLKLGPKETEDLDVPPDVRGSFVHRVMQKLLEENLNLYEESVEYDLYLNQLIEKAKQIIEEQKLKDAFLSQASEPIREFFCERALSVIGEQLKEEINLIREQKKKTIPRYFEWPFGKRNIPPLRIKKDQADVFVSGRIDRIDVNEDKKTFSVIDYKTGELTTGAKLKQGESLQIPLYLMAVQKHLLKNYQPAAGLFIGFKDLAKKSGMIIQGGGEEGVLKKNYHISPAEWEELQDNIGNRVVHIATQINKGNFAPNPQTASLCRFCDYRDICHYDGKDNGES